MKFISFDVFPDVLIIKPDVYPDQRGLFWEIYQVNKYALNGISQTFVQDNVSYSKRGVIRGLHYQLGKPQAKLVMVIDGEIWVADVNIDEGQIPQSAFLKAQLSPRCSQPKCHAIALCGKLEAELAQLDETTAGEFRAEFHMEQSGRDRAIKMSYELLGLVSFFTTASDELKAWPIPAGTDALRAAGKIHSDMERGFIRAEVVSYDDLVNCGSLAEARKKGLLRLEGKSYVVRDGDVITFLFNV